MSVCTRECFRCPLGAQAQTVWVRSRGVEKPKLLLVGEGPGRDEDQQGWAFVGASGVKLHELLARLSIPLDQVRFTNIVRCIPWDPTRSGKVRPPEDQEIQACIDYLWWEVLQQEPAAILALGATATKVLTGVSSVRKALGQRYSLEVPDDAGRRFLLKLSGDPETWREHFSEVKDLPSAVGSLSDPETTHFVQGNGWEWDILSRSYSVFATYHPAAILYGDPEAESSLVQSLQQAWQWATSGAGGIPDAAYQQLDTVEEVRAAFQAIIDGYKAGQFPFLTLDLEHDGLKDGKRCGLDPWGPAELLSFAICTEPGKAIFIPFRHKDSPFIGDELSQRAILQALRELLAIVPINNHNLLYDLLVLWVKAGVRETNPVFDTLLGARWLFTDTQALDLEPLVSRYVGMTAHKTEMAKAMEAATTWVKQGKKRTKIPGTMADIPLDILRKYNSADADGSHRLAYWEIGEIQRLSSDPTQEMGGLQALWDTTTSMIPVALEMRVTGMRADRLLLQEGVEEYLVYLQGLTAWFTDRGYDQAVVSIREEQWWLKEQAKKGEAAKPRKKPKPFNLKAVADKLALIHNVLGTPVLFYTDKGAPSTNKTSLKNYQIKWKEWAAEGKVTEEWASEVIEAMQRLLDFSKEDKLYTSYLRPIPSLVSEDGILHWELGICTTATGRWSGYVHTLPYKSRAKLACSAPYGPPPPPPIELFELRKLKDEKDSWSSEELLAYDHRVRETTEWLCKEEKDRGEGPRGLLQGGDFSQIEARIGAVLAGDETFKAIFRAGGDVHRMVATEIFLRPPEQISDRERAQAKTVVFGIFYKAGAESVAVKNQIPLEQAKQIIADFFRRFPKVKQWSDEQIQNAYLKGFIPTPHGRRRLIDPMLMKYDPDGSVGRMGVNTPVQCAGTELTAQAMRRYRDRLRRLQLKSTLCASIHDNFKTAVYPGELLRTLTFQKKEMVEGSYIANPWFDIPILVGFEVGPRWGRLMAVELDEHERDIAILSGQGSYWPEIAAVLSGWEEPPTTLSMGFVLKDSTGPLCHDNLKIKDGMPIYRVRVRLRG